MLLLKMVSLLRIFLFAIKPLSLLILIRCVYVHDNSPTRVKGEISCMDTEEHYWLGLNSWKVGEYLNLLTRWMLG